MKDDFRIVLVNIINLFKFNSVESIIKFILFVFLIVVASIVIHLVCKFISLIIERKETENKKYKKDQYIQQKEEYYEGYIQGAIDRKTECNNDVIFNRINQANSSVQCHDQTQGLLPTSGILTSPSGMIVSGNTIAPGGVVAPGNKTSNGNSSSSWTVTYGPKTVRPTPVIPPLPINKNLDDLQGDERLAYLKGYIDGHKDDKFWDKQEIYSKLKNYEYKQKG